MKVKLLISELALIETKAHGIYQRLKEELHYEENQSFNITMRLM